MIATASFVLEVRDYIDSHAWSAGHQTQKPVCQESPPLTTPSTNNLSICGVNQETDK